MLKKITFIDYKKEVYKIFIEQDNLYYSVKDEIIILGEYVKDYCVKYFNKSILLQYLLVSIEKCFFNFISSLYFKHISISEILYVLS